MTKTDSANQPTFQQLDPASQEQLVQRSISGNKEALQQLCYAIAPGVLFRTQIILGNYTDAEDVAQEVLLRVYTKISGLRNPKAFNGWLNSILIHEAQRVSIENSKQSAELHNVDELADLPDDDVDVLPQEYTLREEERQTVVESLKQLSVRQREAVLLHYFDGLDVKEVAEAMGISSAGVSLYLKQARVKVKNYLADQLPVAPVAQTTSLPSPTTTPAAAESTAGAPAIVPTGALLALALQQSAQLSSLADAAWIAQVIPQGVAAASSVAQGLGSSVLVKVLVGAFTSLAVMLGFYTIVTQSAPSVPSSVADNSGTGTERVLVQGFVCFTPSDPATDADVNPRQATVTVSTSLETPVPDHWEIYAVGSATVLFSGPGTTAEAPFNQLLAAGGNGQYRITFFLRDSRGDIYQLSRDFYIQNSATSGWRTNLLMASSSNVIRPSGSSAGSDLCLTPGISNSNVACCLSAGGDGQLFMGGKESL